MTTDRADARADASAPPRRQARWKSVVMINSPPSSAPSAASTLSRPHSSQSTASSGASQARARNVTPPPPAEEELAGARQLQQGAQSATTSQQQQRPLFKTRVSVNASPAAADGARADVSGVKRELEQHQEEAAKGGGASELEVAGSLRQKQQQQQELSGPLPAGPVERRPRASFRQASLRRRASFKNCATPRPGSPVPRSPLAERRAEGALVQAAPMLQPPAASSQAPGASDGKQQEDAEEILGKAARQQRQLQRALILAQKYDYSPAKLAASKLGAQLQLQAAGAPSKAEEAGAPPNRWQGGKLDEQQAEAGGGAAQEQAQAQTQAGQVELEIAYFAKSGSLTVHLLQCAHLAPASKRRASSNPYVKLYLLPDRSKQGKRKSAVKRHELAPKFHERFTFGPLQLAEFDERCLWLSVWHKDRGLGRNEPLGELLLPLAQVRAQLLASDLCQTTAPRWYALRQRRHLAEAAASAHDVQAPANDVQAPPPSSSKQLLTTKRVPQSNGHLSLTLARPHDNSSNGGAPRLQQQRAAELVARKLGEFEMKAARLAQQTAPLAPPSGGGGAPAPSVGATRLGAPLEPPLQAQAATHQQAAEFKCMQVAIAADAADATPPPDLDQPPAGQLFVALKFVPDSNDLRRSAHMEGRLELLIKEARNLRVPDASGAAPPPPPPSAYCKCYLLDAFGQRLAKRKTPVVKRSDSPRWDFECRFNSLQLAHLNAQAVELLLLNRDHSNAAAPADSQQGHLGAIRLCKRLGNEHERAGPDLCSEREARLWTQMLARPNIWVYGELPLKRRLSPLIALAAGDVAPR